MNIITRPVGILLVALALLISGALINFFFGFRGEMQLFMGEASNLVQAESPGTDTSNQNLDLGLNLRLDSLDVATYIPEYEIQVWENNAPPSPGQLVTEMKAPKCISSFPLKPMKIQKAANTEFRFRLKEFYPNFKFAYTYPENRDTIKPKAPGIMLELRTSEGEAVVTLRSEHTANPNKLGDVVGLGAVLEFYWELPQDIIDSTGQQESGDGNRIIFAGEKKEMLYVIGGQVTTHTLEEGIYYGMPGNEKFGFTVLHVFPDAAFLKAVPSTDGDSIVNPVAGVELWKVGQGGQEVFLYPDTRGRKSGNFALPGTPYSLTIGENENHRNKFCLAGISVVDEQGTTLAAKNVTGKRSMRYDGYQFRLLSCTNKRHGRAKFQVTRRPGGIAVTCGSVMMLVGLGLMFRAPKHVKSEKNGT